MKVVLIQCWFGSIPDYFWSHYETTKDLEVDFLFVTDQDISLESKNYKILKTSKEDVESSLSGILDVNFKIKSNKKTCDLKASLGHLFEDHIIDYDYFGCYDIDTFFGDFRKYVSKYLGIYDFISIGDDRFHNRLSGPFLLFRNNKEIRELYIGREFISCFEEENVQCFEEQVISKLSKEKYSVKLIDSSSLNLEKGGKNEYEGLWSGGKVFVSGEEKFIYHFYRKEKTSIKKIGNVISAKYDKKYLDDFLWVVHFSEKYETLLPYLMNSLKIYSNRKCVFYSINYTPNFLFKTQLESDQFIFRRIDMDPGSLDNRGRDQTVLCSKPVILMDAIDSFPGKKFVHIDTDIYLTSNSDDIVKYFDRIENYPLMNSHIHDVMYISGVIPGEEWTSTLHILLNEMGENSPPVFPRRKCNIILFDERSRWFFQEQMDLYHQYRGCRPGIFKFHDEDSANALLAKYQFKNSLPLVDIEESYNLNMEKIHNYSYNMTGTSPWAELPKNINSFLFFHGFKSPEDYKKIQEEYGSSTLENEEFVLNYSSGTIYFEKNSFLSNKKISPIVDFVVFDLEGSEIFRLGHQNLYQYSLFYIEGISLDQKKYSVKIFESIGDKCIYNDILEITHN
jgi:hypothetical protein